MIPMLYILCALGAVILLVLFSKISFFCEYKKYPDEKLYTDYCISIGFINLDKLIKKLSQKKPKEVSPETRDEKDSGRLVGKLKKLAKTLKLVKKTYSKNRWYIRRSLRVEQLDFHLKFGFEDAASTGIATGAIWSVLYGLTALVAQVGTLNNHYFEVVPVYTGKGFASEGRTKFSIRAVHAISLFVRLYLTYKKLTKTNKQKRRR